MQRKTESRFVGNTAALAVSAVLTTSLTLAQVKVLAAALTQADFGRFAGLRGFALLVSLLAANGLPQLLVRFLPQHESAGDRRAQLRLSAIAVAGVVVTSAVLVAVVHGLRGELLGFAGGALSTPGFVFWLYATMLGVGLKLVLYGGFAGMRRMGVQVALEVSALAVQLAWIVAVRDDLTMVVLFRILGATSLAVVIVGYPILMVLSGGEDQHAGGSYGSADYRGYWVGATGLSVVAIAFTDVDRYVLSGVLAMEAVGLFHVASRIMRLANRFLSVPVLAFQPEATRLDAEGRHGDVDVALRVFFKFNVAASTFMAMTVIVLAKDLIRLVSSEAYLGGLAVLLLLALSIPITAMTAPLTTVMKARDRVGGALGCDLVYALSYVGLLLVLGRSVGVIGAGIGQLVATAAQLALALWLMRAFPGAGFALRTFAKGMLAGVVAFTPLGVVSLVAPETPLWFLVKALLLLLALWLFRSVGRRARFFASEEREQIVRLLDRPGLRGAAAYLI